MAWHGSWITSLISETETRPMRMVSFARYSDCLAVVQEGTGHFPSQSHLQGFIGVCRIFRSPYRQRIIDIVTG